MKIDNLEKYKKSMKDWQLQNLGKSSKFEKVLQVQTVIAKA